VILIVTTPSPVACTITSKGIRKHKRRRIKRVQMSDKGEKANFAVTLPLKEKKNAR